MSARLQSCFCSFVMMLDMELVALREGFLRHLPLRHFAGGGAVC